MHHPGKYQKTRRSDNSELCNRYYRSWERDPTTGYFKSSTLPVPLSMTRSLYVSLDSPPTWLQNNPCLVLVTEREREREEGRASVLHRGVGMNNRRSWVNGWIRGHGAERKRKGEREGRYRGKRWAHACRIRHSRREQGGIGGYSQSLDRSRPIAAAWQAQGVYVNGWIHLGSLSPLGAMQEDPCPRVHVCVRVSLSLSLFGACCSRSAPLTGFGR